MEPKSLHVTQLERLCRLHGGHKAVAQAAALNPTYVWQVLHGTKLASGAARGVGPKMAAKLEKAYPGWLVSGILDSNETSKTNHGQPESLVVCLARLSQQMQNLQPKRREALAANLSELARSGGAEKWQTAVAALLGILE